MKKVLAILLIAAFVVTTFVALGCAKKEETPQTETAPMEETAPVDTTVAETGATTGGN
ncbi:MAG: hypothetical protein JW952_02820 [Candidatus Eisenbacteria bacterium]|nr:hypothetical protein [Candidatus Eisenbacteria bacterium]